MYYTIKINTMKNSIIDSLVKDFILDKVSKKSVVERIQKHFNFTFIKAMNEFNEAYTRLS